MEAFLLRIAGDLPSAGRFMAGVGSALAVVGALSFVIGRTAAGRRCERFAGRALAWLVASLLLAMVFLSSLQILMRNLFDSGLLWIDPLLRHLVLVLAFSGAVMATAAKRHVQINVLGRLVKGTARRIAGAGVAVVGALICTWLGHASLAFLAEEIEFGEILFLGVPAWAVALVFPVCFLLMGVQFFQLVFRELAGTAPVSEEIALVEWDDDTAGDTA